MGIIDTVKAYERGQGLIPEKYFYSILEGRGRYDKVVAEAKFGVSKRAAAFVRKDTGAIYVAASYSAPARTRIA